MNYQVLHEISFYLMYACLTIAFFISVERGIFFLHTLRHARALEGVVTGNQSSLEELVRHVDKQDHVSAEALKTLIEERQNARTTEQLENLSQAIYLKLRAKLTRHLWILDTIVTAAPLLGLLGTILGIIETFTSLASSGISDPKGVSAGIGTALFATALGISTALFVLIFLNHFNDRVDRISDHLKILILRISAREN